MLKKIAVMAALLSSAMLHAGQYSWQEPHAKALPTGDIEWTPKAFVFEKGESIRYIDFERGDDGNDGLTKRTPWQRHPWDANATANAKACTGTHTYVFKGGVVYRGALRASESGRPGEAIRLTRDPSWGEGAAVLCGSEKVSGWKKGSDHPDLPEPEKIWWVDLDFAPRCVWTVGKDGQVARIPLARTPNWKVSDPDDVKSEWWHWDYKGMKPFDVFTMKGKRKLHLGVDTVHLTKPADHYQDAILWTEHGWVAGAPYPVRVDSVDTAKKGVGFGGRWGGVGSYKIVKFGRYYLEDKPHYLDDPDGEFWFRKRGNGGRLCLRLPGDADPNSVHVEAARHPNLIDSKGMSHVHITGLTFRFTNVHWALDGVPYRQGEALDTACIRLLGSGKDLRVANCLFEHVNTAVRLKALAKEDSIDQVVVSDNEARSADRGGFHIMEGSAWGEKERKSGLLYDVKVLRNKLRLIGLRPTRFNNGFTIDILNAETLEVAGNVVDRVYSGGINVHVGKRGRSVRDCPFSRILVHHNKVTDPLLSNDDFGGIETWQGGPTYVFNNISGNPGGYRNFGLLNTKRPGWARFGHAYYMDGGFKQYYFNNIAWGKSRDPFSRLGNTAAFQEIHGYLATVFNNTVYNFVIGSRRQAPQAGRNKYLGNIWHGIGDLVFRHAPPSKTMADPNAADAGAKESSYHHASNAYAHNVFFEVPEKLAVFEPSGRWHRGLRSFQRALAARKSLGAVGEMASDAPLRAPEEHDFRPTPAAADKGVKVFVPWALHAVVGEWHFYHAGGDPGQIMDEHFHMAPYYVNREDYHKQPMYPLRAVNVGESDYVAGPLEDWVPGALRLNGRDQYAVLAANTTAPKDASDRPDLKNKEYDWIRFETPAEVVPGRRFQVKLHLPGAKPGLKLRADLHWVKKGGRFGGMNSWGGNAQNVKGPGPYTIAFRPQDKPDLSHFLITAWLTPTGDWKDRVKTAQYGIHAATSVPTEGYRSPDIGNTNFLIEAYFRTAPGHTGGVLIEKMASAGYALSIDSDGGVRFAVKGERTDRTASSQARVNDGEWHHVIAEADRRMKTLALYVDGKRDATADGVGPEVSLANGSDLHVGGTPRGRCMAGTIDFLRVAFGTLADAKTTIDELYAWQFDGPFLRDFTGRKPVGRRDAGAIESAEDD